jgi:cobalamin synthase
MQQCPEFEGRIRERNLDTIISSLLLGLGNKRVLIDVEHTPDIVVLLIVILLTLCVGHGGFLHLDGTFDQGFWNSPWADCQVYQAPL